MSGLSISDLSPNLPFGARIGGVTLANVGDAGVRAEILATFETRGMIVFEGVEPSGRMQVALSNVFGELEAHQIKDVPKGDDDVPGLVEFDYVDVWEVDGQHLAAYVPWHFDACYAKELNRGGVLRALTIPPEGGLTGFADGMQLYTAIDPALRDRFEQLNVIYHSYNMFWNMKFGRPRSYGTVAVRDMITRMVDGAKAAPRSVHPAIWQRASGEKVLHVSPWQAAGIEGMEGPEGDQLLEALCQDIYRAMTPYHHDWRPDDMVIWDNWRFIHSVGGYPPQYARKMQRTTIKGDYGLGRLELAGAVSATGYDM